jgi:hypothetical protein
MSSHNSHSRGRARVHNTSIRSWARIESIRWADEPRRSRLLRSISQETTDFISACEALHKRLAQDGPLTWEERDLIEFSALDLLNRVKPLE